MRGTEGTCGETRWSKLLEIKYAAGRAEDFRERGTRSNRSSGSASAAPCSLPRDRRLPGPSLVSDTTRLQPMEAHSHSVAAISNRPPWASDHLLR